MNGSSDGEEKGDSRQRDQYRQSLEATEQFPIEGAPGTPPVLLAYVHKWHCMFGQRESQNGIMVLLAECRARALSTIPDCYCFAKSLRDVVWRLEPQACIISFSDILMHCARSVA